MNPLHNKSGIFLEAVTSHDASTVPASQHNSETTEVMQKYQRIARFSDISEERQQSIKPSTVMMSMDDNINVPLVSLDKAVEPLRSFLHNIGDYVELAKRKCDGLNVLGLSQDQLASITLYTMDWKPHDKCLYFALNSTLRMANKDALKPWLLYIKLIFTALSVLPAVRKTVFRGIKKDMSKEYPIGSTFVWWGFSSCTTTITTLEADSFFGKTETRTLFSIECETGRSIQSYSAYKNENEILIPAGTQFTVVAVLPVPPNVHIIQIKEVRSSLFSQLGNSPAYQNLKLEKLIDQCETIGSELNLSYFGEINDADMLIVVDRALRRKQCSMIYLGNNNIKSEGARILANELSENASLSGIYLGNNPIGDEGVKHLAQALASQKRISVLTILNIGNTYIGDDGARYLAQMLRVNASLTDINLWKNNLSDHGVILLAQALIQNFQSKLTNLNLSYNKQIGNGCINVLIELIQQTQTLKHLNLDGTSISSSGKQRLQKVARKRQNFICYTQSNPSANPFCIVM
ncbi:unnamed protein product [Rotaria magnacalcarata]|uniref:NAD(P)(+)--arginine ADP-ribosyltransferase n=1 Tax=Rotaria magnacalcarata TaxID=392030 RepID=A0A816BWS1_9BILA|nr:unnamed protein product [Rotaria magnacalcarata]CAF1612957.1 unnamed protein product [Rotaria magnacalcarata]CAF2084775.1 unnamed protein product [Rotaria magnacalcarata]CAF3796633.1 unnamed protein product [Rotaria magnacalcarata]CAF3923887.1 unnamed protein product [Rotaria magnacalcarata]